MADTIRSQSFDPYKALGDLKLRQDLRKDVQESGLVDKDTQDPFQKEEKFSFEDVLSKVIETEKDKLEKSETAGAVPGVQNSGVSGLPQGSIAKVENKINSSGFSDNGISKDWGLRN
jgi:hypothetical protein